jgi:hypothetical protein
MSDRLALANAIEEAGIERSKAERVASVIVAAIYDLAATTADVQASEAAVRADVAELSAAMRADLATLRGDVNRPGSAAQADVQAVRGEVGALRGEVQAKFASIDSRVERLDAKVAPIVRQLLLGLGSLMVVLAGLLFAALHYWPPH